MPEVGEAERALRTKLVQDLTNEALDQLVRMRRWEGDAIQDDLVEHCRRLQEQLKAIEERAPVVLQEYHDRLASRVRMLTGDGTIELDQEALCREVAIYAERCDVCEEIVRLRAHVAHFREACAGDEAVGRKLDFLAQEMLREANTIGSKSNDAQIARTVVEMKALIDRIKEQVQNAE